MPFHRKHPVRTYQSLMRDLEPIQGTRERRLRVPGSPSSLPEVEDDPWRAMRKELMRNTLDELLGMAILEGVDMSKVIRKDSKGHVVNAIVRLRRDQSEGGG